MLLLKKGKGRSLGNMGMWATDLIAQAALKQHQVSAFCNEDLETSNSGLPWFCDKTWWPAASLFILAAMSLVICIFSNLSPGQESAEFRAALPSLMASTQGLYVDRLGI